MFGLFKRKTQEEVLQSKYETLMRKWHELSQVNRTESDKVYAEASKIGDQLQLLKSQKS